jgi:hypothetical protein
VLIFILVPPIGDRATKPGAQSPGRAAACEFRIAQFRLLLNFHVSADDARALARHDGFHLPSVFTIKARLAQSSPALHAHRIIADRRLTVVICDLL